MQQIDLRLTVADLTEDILSARFSPLLTSADLPL
jgi:hypothetical protein